MVKRIRPSSGAYYNTSSLPSTNRKPGPETKPADHGPASAERRESFHNETRRYVERRAAQIERDEQAWRLLQQSIDG